MIRSSILVLVALVASAGPGRSQGSGAGGDASQSAPALGQERPSEQEANEKRRQEIKKRIQTYRAMERQGEMVRTHVQVRVKLRNGEALLGVVRDGLFVERPEGLEFTRAEMTQPGAGLRLWYFDNVDGYIFIPYVDIETYRVLKKLTEIEVTEIRDLILERQRQAETQAEERRQQIEQRRQELKEGAEVDRKLNELTQSIEASAKNKQEEQRLLALLQEFPPAEGWGEQRIAELNHRRIAIKVFPNAQEKRFIDNFADWRKAAALVEQRQAAADKRDNELRQQMNDLSHPLLGPGAARKRDIEPPAAEPKKDDPKPELPKEETKREPLPKQETPKPEPQPTEPGEGK